MQGFLCFSEIDKRLKKTFSPRANLINLLSKFILRINTILRRNGDALIALFITYYVNEI